MEADGNSCMLFTRDFFPTCFKFKASLSSKSKFELVTSIQLWDLYANHDHINICDDYDNFCNIISGSHPETM